MSWKHNYSTPLSWCTVNAVSASAALLRWKKNVQYSAMIRSVEEPAHSRALTELGKRNVLPNTAS